MEKLHQEELAKMISLGENKHQDFKYVISDSRKIARSLSAFANTGGGSLLIGVKDNGKVVGISSDEEYYMVESAASIYSRPEVSIKPKIWRYDGKTVLEIIVPESRSKPHYVLEKDSSKIAYIRINDQNIKADEVIRKTWDIAKQNKDRLLRYSEAEEVLFDLLQQNDSINLKFFKKEAQISHKVAVNTLANLILFDLIQMEISEESTKFYLKPDKSIDS